MKKTFRKITYLIITLFLAFNFVNAEIDIDKVEKVREINLDFGEKWNQVAESLSDYTYEIIHYSSHNKLLQKQHLYFDFLDNYIRALIFDENYKVKLAFYDYMGNYESLMEPEGFRNVFDYLTLKNSNSPFR